MNRRMAMSLSQNWHISINVNIRPTVQYTNEMRVVYPIYEFLCKFCLFQDSEIQMNNVENMDKNYVADDGTVKCSTVPVVGTKDHKHALFSAGLCSLHLMFMFMQGSKSNIFSLFKYLD